MSDQKYYITPTGNAITILEGRAAEPLPLKEPQIISIAGDIKSVSSFLSARKSGHSSQKVDPNKVVVTVDKNARTMVMKLDPENHYGATITGKLEASEELKQFGINTTTKYDRKQLLDIIRFNRLFFEDKGEHARVVAALAKIRFKTDIEINQAKDNSGNSRNSQEVNTVADEGFVKEFTLTVPIFKGFPAEKITVEICYEPLNGNITFWLESIGLKEATDGQIDKIFEKELESCTDFVVINK